MRGTSSSRSAWPTTFKAAFCEKFNCPPGQYEQTVFWRGLYLHAVPLAALIYWFRPDVFKVDFELIREISQIDNLELFQIELDCFHERNFCDRSWLRNRLLIRVSTKRLLRLKRRVMGL